MSVPDAHVIAQLPYATALVCAVQDRDLDEVARVLHDPDVDLETVAVILADLVPDDLTLDGFGQPSLPTILSAVSAGCDVSGSSIRSESRIRVVTDARHVFAYLAAEFGHSSPTIGRYLGRDHTTILYAVQRVRRTPKLRTVAHSILSLLRSTDEAA